MDPNELRQKKSVYLGDATEIQALAKEEKREQTDDETSKINELLDKADALDAEIAKAEDQEKQALRLSQHNEVLSKPQPRKTEPAPIPSLTPPTGTSADVSNDIRVGKELLADDPRGGYREEAGMGHYFLDVKDAAMDRGNLPRRLATYGQAIQSAAGDGMNTFIGPDGAYLIPTAFGKLIDNIALEEAVIRPRAKQIPMDRQSITFPAIDDTTHANDTVFGGVQAYWPAEEAQLTSSKPSTAVVELQLHALKALAFVSGEFRDWSAMAVDAWLPDLLGQAIAWKEDSAFIGGVGGSGIPVGVLNTPATLTISAETGQKAASLVYENIVNMDSRLWHMGAGASVIWIANRTLKKALPFLTINVGTAGDAVFQPANAAAGRPLSTLYGFPIVFTEHAEVLGTVGDITLCNLKDYMVGTAVGKTRTDRSIHLKFDFDQIAYRVVTYTGGVSRWRTPFQPRKGETLSPFVKLATRS